MNKCYIVTCILTAVITNNSFAQECQMYASYQPNEKVLAQKYLSRAISAADAYMAGTFGQSATEGNITFPDYETQDAMHDVPLPEVRTCLKDLYSQALFKIQGWTPFDYQLTLMNLPKEEKIKYFKEISIHDKIAIQSLRLYDFIKIINVDLPEDKQQELRATFSPEEENDYINKINKELKDTLQAIISNRKQLASAIEHDGVPNVLVACKQKLYLTEKPASLSQCLENSIKNIENDYYDPILDNQSRVNQSCTIS